MTEGCSDTQPDSTPGWLRWVTRISVAVGLAALIATIWIVGPAVILGHLRAIGWVFAVIVAVDVMSSVCDATAVYYMAHGPGRPRWRDCVIAQLAGRGVNAVTPGGNLGEALKVGLLSRRCPPRRIIAAVLYVGLILVVFSFAVIATGTAATAFLFDLPRPAIVALLVGALVAAGVAVGIVVLLRRGMLSTLTAVLARLHIVSRARRERWHATLEEIDARLRGRDAEHRRRAIAYIAISQALQKCLAFLVVYAAGYTLGPGQFLALISAGVLLGWISTVIPMGLGISEGGHVALFSLIGAPASLGLALAIARRVNQVVFATIGFIVLTADRLGTHLRVRVGRLPQIKAATP